MPWVLQIHIIDVGQGESSLIIARNTAFPFQRRTMLIDGGLSIYAETVHDYIVAQGIAQLDHILISHYDMDHSGGVVALLTADNLYNVCDVIARPAAREAELVAGLGSNNGRANRIAAAAAATYAAALGAYDDPNGDDHSGKAFLAALSTHIPLKKNTTDDGAIEIGVREASRTIGDDLNPPLIKSTTKLNTTVSAASIAAAKAIAGGNNVLTYTRNAVFRNLYKGVSAGARFQTGGIYHNTHIIDTGDTGRPDGYTETLFGSVLMSSSRVAAPGIDRWRTGNPNLGSEALWNSGPNAIDAPANSPAVFVVARNKYIWEADNNDVPIPGAIDNNSDSIGLILRFNRFFYYTGGDLPTAGEDLIADAVMNNGLPDPQDTDNTFATPHRIACFKCGHHGSQHSTSQNFLDTTLARGAFISSGDKSFGKALVTHPTQEVIDRLHGTARIKYFYLTNCRTIRNYIPASGDPPQNQLSVFGNKSRLAGDNAENNLQDGRPRGDIRISINQAESASTIVMGPLQVGQSLRQYHVRYYDSDYGIEAFRVEDVTF